MMKSNLSHYIDAQKLSKEITALFEFIPNHYNRSDTITEWVSARSKDFRNAFLKLVPKIEFFCKDYAIPLSGAYCKFTLLNADASRIIFSHDGSPVSKKESCGLIDFFYFLHDAIKYDYRVEGLQETEFFKLFKQMTKSK